MKRIYFLIIFLSLSAVTFSQQITSNTSNIAENFVVSDVNSSFTMNYDFNNDGSSEVFKGTMLKTINANTFWVKNAQILSSDNKALVTLGYKLLVNNITLVNQVSARYGYIVEFVKGQHGKNIVIAIANENGEKDSDDLVINLDDL